jgi:hypothetical protein
MTIIPVRLQRTDGTLEGFQDFINVAFWRKAAKSSPLLTAFVMIWTMRRPINQSIEMNGLMLILPWSRSWGFSSKADEILGWMKLISHTCDASMVYIGLATCTDIQMLWFHRTNTIFLCPMVCASIWTAFRSLNLLKYICSSRQGIDLHHPNVTHRIWFLRTVSFNSTFADRHFFACFLTFFVNSIHLSINRCFFEFRVSTPQQPRKVTSPIW